MMRALNVEQSGFFVLISITYISLLKVTASSKHALLYDDNDMTSQASGESLLLSSFAV